MFNKNNSSLKRYHLKRKQRIEDLGGSCYICGEKENLEFDHINPDIKEVPISKYWDTKKAEAELIKCQLLCKTCHDKKHEAKHGTISRYRHHKCRCDECKKAWSNACKKWKNK